MKNNLKTPTTGMQELTERLKSEDANYARISKSFQIVYWAFIPVYLFISVMEFRETGDSNNLYAGICYALSFLVFALVFRNYYREYKYVNYSLSTLEMLKNAARRYKPFRRKTAWVIAALIFLDAGLCFNSYNHFNILKFQALFISALIVAFMIGMIIWKIKYKPIRDVALSLVAEIEKT